MPRDTANLGHLQRSEKMPAFVSLSVISESRRCDAMRACLESSTDHVETSEDRHHKELLLRKDNILV